MSKLAIVVPTIRPDHHRQFKEAWWSLITKHKATLITIWDGDSPHVTEQRWNDEIPHPAHVPFDPKDANLFCRFSDCCRNLGFVAAASMGADYILTLDDDVKPIAEDDAYWLTDFMTVDEVVRGYDPIQSHLDALSLRVPLSWMNTAHMGSEYLRGVPYGVREESPVMLSHGVWVGTPDFDGETQLRLERCPQCNGTGFPAVDAFDRPCSKCNGTGKNPTGIPKTLPYYVGPVPKGVFMPICAMNVMIRREMLPYYYLAPMGADSGYPDLHRFGDIWGGIFALKAMWERGWAAWSGSSTVLHQRASDAVKNEQQERLGREWNEHLWTDLGNCEGRYCPRWKYFDSYREKRYRFADLIRSIQGGK